MKVCKMKNKKPNLFEDLCFIYLVMAIIGGPIYLFDDKSLISMSDRIATVAVVAGIGILGLVCYILRTNPQYRHHLLKLITAKVEMKNTAQNNTASEFKSGAVGMGNTGTVNQRRQLILNQIKPITKYIVLRYDPESKVSDILYIMKADNLWYNYLQKVYAKLAKSVIKSDREIYNTAPHDLNKARKLIITDLNTVIRMQKKLNVRMTNSD